MSIRRVGKNFCQPRKELRRPLRLFLGKQDDAQSMKGLRMCGMQPQELFVSLLGKIKLVVSLKLLGAGQKVIERGGGNVEHERSLAEITNHQTKSPSKD